MLDIRVQKEDFNLQEEYQKLVQDSCASGAALIFVGLVRDFNQGHDVKQLYLEHYPEMTEKSLLGIAKKAQDRWPIDRIVLIHRVGKLHLNEQIVLVGTASSHRESAFDATRFMMDYLKTEAPFWKKEITPQGQRWVDAEMKDMNARKAWE